MRAWRAEELLVLLEQPPLCGPGGWSPCAMILLFSRDGRRDGALREVGGGSPRVLNLEHRIGTTFRLVSLAG